MTIFGYLPTFQLPFALFMTLKRLLTEILVLLMPRTRVTEVPRSDFGVRLQALRATDEGDDESASSSR